MNSIVFTCAYKTIPMKGIEDDTASTKRILQKIVYLLQQLGLDSSYYFGWYIYGPYSPMLSEDFEDWLKAKKFVELTKKHTEIIDKLNSMLSKLPSTDYLYWVELIASLHYAGSPSLLYDLVKRYKPQDIKFAWDLLRSYRLVNSIEEFALSESSEQVLHSNNKRTNNYNDEHNTVKYLISYLYLTARTDTSKYVVLKLARILGLSAEEIEEISKEIDLNSIKID